MKISLRTFFGLASVLLLVSACANAPAPHPKTVIVVPPTAVPPPAPAQMAPIPNPESDSERHAAAETHAPKPARAKPDQTQARGPSEPATNPAKAAALREQGLVELNRGAIAKAVVLLQQASRLDPANPLIRRDLERATRINQLIAAKP